MAVGRCVEFDLSTMAHLVARAVPDDVFECPICWVEHRIARALVSWCLCQQRVQESVSSSSSSSELDGLRLQF